MFCFGLKVVKHNVSTHTKKVGNEHQVPIPVVMVLCSLRCQVSKMLISAWGDSGPKSGVNADANGGGQ